ncbi:MAG: SoxR reducing system RseC family protein [Candidatus Marinimicrobia bacterium]|nr:SoxR reducing system RseC family protein [Candidatus Neomarinimicrobiota bacterium]
MSLTAQTNGKVESLEGDFAIVLMQPQRSPSRYSLPLFPVLPLKTRNEPVHIPVPNDLDAKPGDLVELTETSSFLIQLSAIQYGIPGLGFVTGLLIGYFLHPQSLSMPLELYQFFLGLGGLVLGGFIGYKWAKSLASKPEKFYRMERVL